MSKKLYAEKMRALVEELNQNFTTNAELLTSCLKNSDIAKIAIADKNQKEIKQLSEELIKILNQDAVVPEQQQTEKNTTEISEQDKKKIELIDYLNTHFKHDFMKYQPANFAEMIKTHQDIALIRLGKEVQEKFGLDMKNGNITPDEIYQFVSKFETD